MAYPYGAAVWTGRNPVNQRGKKRRQDGQTFWVMVEYGYRKQPRVKWLQSEIYVFDNRV